MSRNSRARAKKLEMRFASSARIYDCCREADRLTRAARQKRAANYRRFVEVYFARQKRNSAHPDGHPK